MEKLNNIKNNELTAKGKKDRLKLFHGIRYQFRG